MADIQTSDSRAKWEFIFLILTGTLHILTKEISLFMHWDTESLYGPGFIGNMAFVILWVGYAIYRIKESPGILKEWGFRLDNFKQSGIVALMFGLPASFLLLGYGTGWKGYRYPFSSLALIFFLYPLWGLAQQSALQVFANRNLKIMGLPLVYRIPLVASLFSLSHFRNYALMILVFPLGVVGSWIYEKKPNLWVLAILHGILGMLAYFFILGEDPGSPLILVIRRFFQW